MNTWNGRKISKLRTLVLEVYGSRCHKCKGWINLDLRYPHPRSFSIGHQLPRSLGGSDDITNLRPEHLQCNLKAGARLGATARPYEVPDQPAAGDPPPDPAAF